MGTSTNGCSTSALFSLSVNPLPVVSYSTSNATNAVCKGETVTFTAGTAGSVINSWSTNSGVVANDVYSFKASITITVNLLVTSSVGCQNSESFVLTVDDCTGLAKIWPSSVFKLYPNPGNGVYIFESGNSGLKHLEITDLTGKIIFTSET